MVKPIIGIAPGVVTVTSQMFPGRVRDYVERGFLKSGTGKGGVPWYYR